MSLATIKNHAIGLSTPELRELMLYLQYVCDHQHIDLARGYADALDDKTETRWMDWRDLRDELQTAP